jgi:hypothetical protein
MCLDPQVFYSARCKRDIFLAKKPHKASKEFLNINSNCNSIKVKVPAAVGKHLGR